MDSSTALRKPQLGQFLPGMLQRIAEAIERHNALTLVVFSVIYWAITALLGATKLLWYDELWTYYPAKLASTAATWNFFMQGNDLHTPLASLLVRGSTALFGNNDLAVRLPVIACYWLMCVCIYAFVSHRCSRIFAAAAMVFPVVASTYYYATEARPYGIVLGFSAASLLCWQRATSADPHRRAWRVLALWFCCAMTVFAHFLGFLVVGALVCAEALRAFKRKRIDVAVAIALLLGFAPLFVFLPAALRAKRIYAGSFWARPSPMDIVNTYRDLFNLALFPLAGALILWGIACLYIRRQRQSADAPLPVHEVFAVSLIAFVPVWSMPMFFVMGSFVSRYVLYTIIGLTVALTILAYRASRADRVLGAALLLVFVGWYLLKAPSSIRSNIAQRGGNLFGEAHPFEDTTWMPRIERSDLPILATPAVFFLQLQHYAAPEVRKRILYAYDKNESLRYTGTSTGELNLQILSRVTPVQAIPYDSFITRNNHFLVCAEMTNPTWVVQKLLDQGATLRLICKQDTHLLFDVQLASQRPAI